MKIYYDRWELYQEAIKGKESILNVGSKECIYHERMKDMDLSVVGVDIDHADLNQDLNENTDINFIWLFDLIILGELIEHINNPFMLLESCKKALTKDGEILITTPNARMLNISWKAIKEHPQHIYCWDLTLLKRFCERAGLKIIDEGYVSSYRTKPLMQFIPDKALHIFVRCQVRK